LRKLETSNSTALQRLYLSGSTINTRLFLGFFDQLAGLVTSLQSLNLCNRSNLQVIQLFLNCLETSKKNKLSKLKKFKWNNLN
jgi:hypothetical protein